MTVWKNGEWVSVVSYTGVRDFDNQIDLTIDQFKAYEKQDDNIIEFIIEHSIELLKFYEALYEKYGDN